MYSVYIQSGPEEKGGVGSKGDKTFLEHRRDGCGFYIFTAIGAGRNSPKLSEVRRIVSRESWRRERSERSSRLHESRRVLLRARESNSLENRFPLRRQSAVRGRATPYMYELAPLLLTERESLYRVM